jgi:serine/threonine protein kinase
MSEDRASDSIETVGPYILHRQIARGGMATIHVARLIGDEGFSRIVAAKRMLPQFAEDAEFVSMFIDEAKIASKVQHQNVVKVLDVVTTGGEVILVQEYVHGVPLNALLDAARTGKERVPIAVAVSIASQILTGLHAAHETMGPRGSLGIVHRDVSPGNVIVSVDGTALLLDFGVAKATMTAHITRAGTFKGKRSYSSPEQLRGAATRQSDIYSLAVVLWELLTGRRLHPSRQGEYDMLDQIMSGTLPTVTEALADQREHIDDGRWLQLRALEPIVIQGLAVDLNVRYPTAAAMDAALISIVRPASTGEVAAWVKTLGRDFLEKRDRVLAEEETGWRTQAAGVARSRTTADSRRSRQTAAISQPMTELGTSPVPSRPTTPSETSAPQAGRTNLTIAILGGLAVMLSIAIVVATHGSGPEPSAPAPHVAEPPAIAPSAPEPDPTPVPAAAATNPTAAEPAPAIESSTPSDLLKPAPDEARAKRSEIAPTKTKATRPKALPSTQTKQHANCSPPYYFKATKKIFKPQCL